MPLSAAELRALLAHRAVVLAPMEDVSDAVFRRLCRTLGAELCVTEFVNVDGLLGRSREAMRKIQLAPDDQPTAIQIYGSDPERLAEAARLAEASAPAYVDINCGCWIPRIRGRGAGAGWLRDPDAMVAMTRLVVQSTSLPVTVKTRIGLGTESVMPVVDLARRLEDTGIHALTIHCRTAHMGYTGDADWSFAARARAAVSIPVVVNGDIRSAEDAARALAETGCDAVMIGRRAMDHPWIFREARALLAHGVHLPPPTAAERLALYRDHLLANVATRGPRHGVFVTRRHLKGYLSGVPGGDALRRQILVEPSLDRCLALVDGALARLQAEHAVTG